MPRFGFAPLRAYPFGKAAASLLPVGRRTWTPAVSWSPPDDAPPQRARAALNAAEALADPAIPPELRNKVIAAILVGGEFAARVASSIADLADSDQLEPAVAAAILRALNPKPDMDGDYQVGDGSGSSSGVATGDAWARGGSDPWAGGKGPAPAKPLYAEPSDNPGYLFSTDWREGKARTLRGLTKRGKPTRLERKCELIAAGPFNVAPDMKAIERQVEREFKLGLLAA
jgi:hypothetical protein